MRLASHSFQSCSFLADSRVCWMVVFALARVALLGLAELGLVGGPVHLVLGVTYSRVLGDHLGGAVRQRLAADGALEQVHGHALLLEERQDLLLATVGLHELGDLVADFLVGHGYAELLGALRHDLLLHQVVDDLGDVVVVGVAALLGDLHALRLHLRLGLGQELLEVGLGHRDVADGRDGVARHAAAAARRCGEAGGGEPRSATAAIRTVVTRLIRVPLVVRSDCGRPQACGDRALRVASPTEFGLRPG